MSVSTSPTPVWCSPPAPDWRPCSTSGWQHACRAAVVDPDVFVDTSSSGPQAFDGLIRALGLDGLVLGSDRPYADPLTYRLDDATTRLVRVDNPHRALGPRLDVPTLEGVA